MNITEYLKSQGLRTVGESYRSRIDDWMSWYAGKVKKFHSYSVYNGIRQIGVERASLNMAKTVAEDWANLLLNERVQICVDGDAAQRRLDALLLLNRFEVYGNRTVELAFASGTGAFTQYRDADGASRIDYHDARDIWPLSWSRGQIIECAFSDAQRVRGRKCVYLRMYRLNDDGTYRIENRWLDDETGEPVAPPEGVMEVVQTGMRVPLFQIITPNLANNVDSGCPLGISVFANAIDALKGVDVCYDSFRNEFILGRKRLMVPVSMVKLRMEQDGVQSPMFDPNDLVYTAYQPSEDQKDGFHDLSPEIRAEQHLTGLRTQLSMLSTKCGLGTSRYEFDRASGVRTATEVISEQSDLYQSMRKHELVLRDALVGLVRALLALDGLDAGDVRIVFDDSIIQDRSTLRAEAREEVAAGLMSKYRYLTEIVGLNAQDAQEEIERIRAESSVSAEAMDFFSAKGAETP